MLRRFVSLYRSIYYPLSAIPVGPLVPGSFDPSPTGVGGCPSVGFVLLVSGSRDTPVGSLPARAGNTDNRYAPSRAYMATEITDAHADVPVVTADGETVGTVTRVEDGVAYVDPDRDAPDTLVATLGWEAENEAGDGDDHPLPRTAIDSVGEDEIRLRRGGSEIDRSDEGEHDPDVDPAREAEAQRTDDASEEARERAREEDAQQEVEDSVEREAAARESSNPDAHRDEEPFNS